MANVLMEIGKSGSSDRFQKDIGVGSSFQTINEEFNMENQLGHYAKCR